MGSNLLHDIKLKANEMNFSGSILVKNKDKEINFSLGYANRSEQLPNQATTRFGIASGCKLITAIAICQLVDRGQLTFNTTLRDCLKLNFEQIDSSVSVHQLLTHCSGVPDYFDEEMMDDFEQLWVKQPMYLLRKLTDFLPLFENQPMKFSPGERFHYNNGGYILLGLIVEQVSGMSFADYVVKHIFSSLNMDQSGYFAFDHLPQNTALGYIENPDGSWRTNIYALPVVGGSDGGAYLTTRDVDRLLIGLIEEKLLTASMTRTILTPHVHVDGQTYYGYGLWIDKDVNGEILKYHIMGYDPGVSFHASYYPTLAKRVVVCSNQSVGAGKINEVIEKNLLNHLN
ncbi:serine hydrolase domain-containing protein [Amphibacillus sediminis]|uniref:serine hydrolase domain-containing protein n=1 Tax=Amphibacillus sediminis TaxID=360185 RepID=UPI0035716AAE